MILNTHLCRFAQSNGQCPATGALRFLVASQSRVGAAYSVTIEPRADGTLWRHTCECTSHRFRPATPCVHCVAALLHWRRVVETPHHIEGHLRDEGQWSPSLFAEKMAEATVRRVFVLRHGNGRRSVWSEGEVRPAPVEDWGTRLAVTSESPLFQLDLYTDAANIADKVKMLAHYESRGVGIAFDFGLSVASQRNRYEEAHNAEIVDLGFGAFGPLASVAGAGAAI